MRGCTDVGFVRRRCVFCFAQPDELKYSQKDLYISSQKNKTFRQRERKEFQHNAQLGDIISK